MLSNSTRLELVIVSAVLLVLMLSNRSPRSGNAEIQSGRLGMSAQMPSSDNELTLAIPPLSDSSMQGVPEMPPADEMPPVDVQPKLKRIGIVDARASGNPKYAEVMYGEVTVRWIWNGQRMIPKKVCVVDEGNGVTSIWSFDEQDGVTVTERLVPADTPQP